MKLGLGHQNSLENRRLAIDMAAQLVEWEKRTLEGPPDRDAGKRTREEAGLQVICRLTHLNSYQPSPSLQIVL